MSEREVNARAVAESCVALYNSLPARGAKPGIRADGKREWTVLAGLVIFDSLQDSYTPIALATGVKVLPHASCALTGDLVRDSHAEVLTRRAARSWMLQRLMLEDTQPSGVIGGLRRLFEKQADGRWKLSEEVKLCWYVSTLPCGDASSSLILAQHAAEDAHEASSAPTLSRPHPSASVSTLRGRATLLAQSSLRTKPGRPDSPPSISHSCTDKLSLWSVVGLQGSLLSSLLHPVYASVSVIGEGATKEAWLGSAGRRGEVWNSELRRAKEVRCEEALAVKARQAAQRIKDVMFRHHPLQVSFVDVTFAHSREAVQASAPGAEIVAAAGSVVWTRDRPKPEMLVEGLKQGASAKRSGPDQPLRQSARSHICKLELFRAFDKASSVLIDRRAPLTSYRQGKRLNAGAQGYRSIKALSRGAKDEGDLDSERRVKLFLQTAAIPVGAEPGTTSAVAESMEAFDGWLISDGSLEQFGVDGKVAFPK